MSVEITTTPEIYLSYHDNDLFPNIEASLAKVKLPILWLAGQDDPLTAVLNDTFGIPAKIPTADNNLYKVIAGDHFTLVSNVDAELDPWFKALP